MYKADRLILRKATPTDMDSVKARQSKLFSKDKDIHLLDRCRAVWMNMEDFRQQRARGIRFAYGDQWGDTITVNGETMTYRKYLMDTGNVVIQTNQIKNRIETLAGQTVRERMEPVCHAIDRDEQQFGEVMTATLQANCEKNVMPELYKMFIRELCYGGIATAYESFDDVSGPLRSRDSWTTFVNPNLLIMDSDGVDPRHWDINLIGRIKMYNFSDLCATYAKKPADFSILKDIYPGQADPFRTEEARQMNEKFDDTLVFMKSSDPTMCCVCEVWTKENKPRIRLWDHNNGTEEIIEATDTAYRKEIREENLRRKRMAGTTDDSLIPYITGDGFGATEEEKNGWFMDTYWYCRILAVDGTILWEGESPYADRSHPFSVCVFPFADGKAVGYMTDAIDHNLAMNRAVILHDWLMRAQAKGITVVPKQLVPADVSYQEFANSWTNIDDIVYIDVKPGYEHLMPEVFHGAAQTFDLGGLIATYSKLLDQGSPVNDAMQGRTPNSGTPASLYAQMSNNASTSVAALMESFTKFKENILNRKLKNIILFYEPERYKKIVGQIDGIFDNLNLNEIPDIEYDLTLKESSNTPIARAIVNQDAKEFLMSGLITMEEYLTIADVPYADKILQGRQAREAEIEEAERRGIPIPQDNTPPLMNPSPAYSPK